MNADRNNLGNIEIDHNRLQPVLKLVISGHIYEWYEFEISPRKPEKKNGKRIFKTKDERLVEYIQSEDRQKNFNKTKKQIERLIYANPQLTKFLTLTFAGEMSDIETANTHFHNFVARLRRLYPEFQYIAVPEFQKRGAVHYHLLCFLPYVRSKTISEVWSHGFIKIKRTDRVKDMAKYMTKYLTKDLFDGRLFGKKKFFCSRELNRPEVLYDEEALSRICSEVDLLMLYQNEFPAPYFGTIKYVLYEKDNRHEKE